MIQKTFFLFLIFIFQGRYCRKNHCWRDAILTTWNFCFFQIKNLWKKIMKMSGHTSTSNHNGGPAPKKVKTALQCVKFALNIWITDDLAPSICFHLQCLFSLTLDSDDWESLTDFAKLSHKVICSSKNFATTSRLAETCHK